MARSAVSVLVGEAARGRLADRAFMAAWRELFDACPWATAGQRPEFVEAWYRVYREQEEPILLVAWQGNRMVGCLPLSRPLGEAGIGAPLQQAGHTDCEYQVWLATPERGNSFFPRAVAAVERELGPQTFDLGYLPPDMPRDWLERGLLRLRCELGQTERRVVRVSDRDEVEAFLRGKKRLRTTMNKLKRTGDISIRRLHTVDEILSALPRFQAMFEFRKAAVFNVLPFRDAPLRMRLLQEQAKVPGLLHVTVLERDGQMLAAHVGTAGKRELSIAGIVHCEFESHHSPGTLLQLELTRMLCEEGFELLDLTPGADAYKKRMSKVVEPVYTLVVHRSPAHAAALLAKRELVSVGREGFKRLPTSLRERLSSLRTRLRPTADEQAAEGLAGVPAFSRLHTVPPPPESAAPGSAWVRNDITVLQHVQADRAAYLQLLKRAHAHVRADGQLYCRMDGGRVQAMAFVTPAGAVSTPVALPEGAHVLAELDYLDGQPSELPEWVAELARHVRPGGDAPLFVALRDEAASQRLAQAGFPRVL